MWVGAGGVGNQIQEMQRVEQKVQQREWMQSHACTQL